MDALALRRLDPEHLRPAFDCGDDDLNEYFFKDSIDGGRELISVTYSIEDGEDIIAFISVSNDSVRAQDMSRSRFRSIVKLLPHRKRYKNLPAVKIGRLAVSRSRSGQGVGTALLDFVKGWFTNGNKTGCRFIIVDAYNNEKTLGFYEKNGFRFLLESDAKETTRLMYFDLRSFRR